MAWSWSHTQEAYDYAERRVYDLPLKTLAEVAAQWVLLKEARQKDPDVMPHEVDYSDLENVTAGYMLHQRRQLAGVVWEFMSEAATCSNGGWEAWCDPEGYVTVPFSADNRWED